MRLLLFMALSSFSFSVVADRHNANTDLGIETRNYSVQVLIDGGSDTEAVDKARKAVIWKAALNYPALISGVEGISSTGEFSSELTALTAGAVNVRDVELKWDRESGVLNYTGEAFLDQSLSLELIKGVKDNLTLQKELNKVYRVLNAAMASELIDVSAFEQGIDDAGAVSVVHYVRGDLADSLKAKHELEMHFDRYVLRNILKPLIKQSEFKLVDFDKGRVVYEVDFTKVLNHIAAGFGDDCVIYARKDKAIQFSVVPGSCHFSSLYNGTPVETRRELPFAINFGTEIIDEVNGGPFSSGKERYQLTFHGDENEISTFINDPGHIKELITITP
ncbi:hypothetical protein C9975_04600 [Thalassospira xiamenensis]|nr:hypothetical protein C9975_04600 [Thalassospira xiamenensis]